MWAHLPFIVEEIPPEKLELPKAVDLAATVVQYGLPFVKLIACCRCVKPGGPEVVILDVDIERGQKLANPIEKTERIAVAFDTHDHSYPEVLALRADFPDVPHLNLRTWKTPKSLCLFDEPYQDYKLRWTSLRLVERIREWLAATSRGQLHEPDQPLEPLMMDSAGYLIVSAPVLDEKDPNKAIPVLPIMARSGESSIVLRVTYPADGGSSHHSGGKHFATVFVCPPVTHGVIRSQPKTLGDLCQACSEAGFDLLNELRQRLAAWRGQKATHLLTAQLILIMAMQKTRRLGGPVESVELWAYLFHSNVEGIGTDIGIWERAGDASGVMIEPIKGREGQNSAICPLRVVSTLTTGMAAAISGTSACSEGLAVVGVGAIGSQVVMNLARAGVVPLAVIDNDLILPHNLVRHSLTGDVLGFSKAEGIAHEINSLYDNEPLARAIHADVLNPGDRNADVEKVLTEASVILDMAASVSVSRHLCRSVRVAGRRVSAFLNAQGTDSIILAEDRARLFPLDALEMQYYRHAATDVDLANHFLQSTRLRRYANACRDRSVVLSGELVSAHAAICSRSIRHAIASDHAAIRIHRADDSLGMRIKDFIPRPVTTQSFGNYQVVMDEYLVEKVHHARISRLPSETGGVLIGAYDLERKIIYIVDTILSPPDSIEWPTVYIRGCQGLLAAVQQYGRLSGDNLEYVGEWHSHPDGYSCQPSDLDIEAFRKLTAEMGIGGHPSLMMIVGEREHAIYVGQMAKT